MNNLKTLLTLFATTSTLLGVAVVKPSYASEYSSEKSNYVEAVNYETNDSETFTYSKNHTVKYVGYTKQSEEKKDYDDDKSDRQDYKKNNHEKRYNEHKERKSHPKPKCYKKTNHYSYH